MARSALELHASADRGVCLFVCALTHSHGLEREIVSVLLAARLCETEGCPYTVSSRSIIDFLRTCFFLITPLKKNPVLRHS